MHATPEVRFWKTYKSVWLLKQNLASSLKTTLKIHLNLKATCKHLFPFILTNNNLLEFLKHLWLSAQAYKLDVNWVTDNPRWRVARGHISGLNAIKPTAAIEEAVRLGNLRASVSEWQQSSVGIFCWKHDHIILIKSTNIADFISNQTLRIFFEGKPSDLCWTTSFNIGIGIYQHIYDYRRINEFRDRWNLPWTADQPALAQVDPEKNGCEWWPDIRKTYFNFQQPLVGAALLSFFGVVSDCLESELSWINR